MTVELKRIHHVAYRCKDAKQTVDWYKEMLNMELTVAIAENEVPSTKAPTKSPPWLAFTPQPAFRHNGGCNPKTPGDGS